MKKTIIKNFKFMVAIAILLPFFVSSLNAQKIMIRKKDKLANRKALTWCVLKKWGDLVKVGVHKDSDPYVGDTNIQESLPILAIEPNSLELPPDFPEKISGRNGWAGSYVAITKPIKGADITSLKMANEICANEWGENWQMAEFHDGNSGWRFWAYAKGDFEIGERFWIRINDQQSNPWNFNRSANAKRLSSYGKSAKKENKYFKDDKKNKIQDYFIRNIDNSNLVKEYIAHGADVNYILKDQGGKTPLMITTAPLSTEILIMSGADIEIQDDEGRTVLFHRMKDTHGFNLKYLLEAKVNVNHKDKTGQTPIFWAIRYDKKKFVRKLIEQGADIQVQDNNGVSVFQYAVQKKRNNIVETLIESGLKNNKNEMNKALIEAAGLGYLKIVKILIENGADKSYKDEDMNNALFYAVRNKHTKVIEYLKKI